MEKFNNSIAYDKVMWEEDIEGSKQYAKALVECGILSQEECLQIEDGLEVVRKEWLSGSFQLTASDEDIHTATERRLIELIGSVGGKLHTGRSRNDQVATDVRLWLRKKVRQLKQRLVELILLGSECATTHIDVLQAGYTHLQPAQVVRYSHWLMSHMIPLARDLERLDQLLPRINVCPLGSGALAGHPFGINRVKLAESLGFCGPSINSLDATCDRDFVVEMMQWASLLMIHLSQFAEDCIIMNMNRSITLSDAYATGSSLMPQKKNPDALELLRGKTGRVIGNSTGFMCTLKGLPRAYNKDLQEDKEPLFDTVQTVDDCLSITAGVLATMTPNETRLRLTLSPEMLATDVAEYLVRKGVPFRETHHIAGAAVKLAEDRNELLNTLTIEDLQSLHPLFEADVKELWSYEHSAESRYSIGGTAKQAVLDQIATVTSRVRIMSENV
jgi:argininosuccinate lyase